MNFRRIIFHSIFFVGVAASSAALAHGSSSETSDSNFEPDMDFDQFQIGVPDDGNENEQPRQVMGPGQSLEQPNSIKAEPKPKVPPVFGLASNVFKAVVNEVTLSVANTARGIASSAPTADSTPKVLAETKSLSSASPNPGTFSPGPALTGGPKTEELTRDALQSEEKFQREVSETRAVPETYAKILTAIEKSEVKPEPVEESETGARNSSKAGAKKTTRRKLAKASSDQKMALQMSASAVKASLK